MTRRPTTKSEIRRIALARRDAQPDLEKICGEINRRVLALPEVVRAQQISCYVSFGSEVNTGLLIQQWIEQSKQVYVPYCDGPELGLFHIGSLDELRPGTMGIPEPPLELRVDSKLLCEPSALDLFIVPGLAFSRSGDRIGYGKGYYDRLLARVPGATKIGICFDCQLFDRIPTVARDVSMDKIVTESQVLESGRTTFINQ